MFVMLVAGGTSRELEGHTG